MREQIRKVRHHRGDDASFLLDEIVSQRSRIEQYEYAREIVRELKAQLLSETNGIHSGLVNELGRTQRAHKQDIQAEKRKLLLTERALQQEKNTTWIIEKFQQYVGELYYHDDGSRKSTNEIVDMIYTYCDEWQAQQTEQSDTSSDIRYIVYRIMRGSPVYHSSTCKVDYTPAPGVSKVPDIISLDQVVKLS